MPAGYYAKVLENPKPGRTKSGTQGWRLRLLGYMVRVRVTCWVSRIKVRNIGLRGYRVRGVKVRFGASC